MLDDCVDDGADHAGEPSAEVREPAAVDVLRRERATRGARPP